MSVDMSLFGQDHWSTFAYAETCAVDHNGYLSNAKMRCDLRRHRELCHNLLFGPLDGSTYPTRLNNDTQIHEHDDWDCLGDLEAAGLLKTSFSRDPKKRSVKFDYFGGHRGRVKFTDSGWDIAAQLRQWKGDGNSFNEFRPKVMVQIGRQNSD